MYRIGVDIGGTGIQAGLVNLQGEIIGQKECSTNVKLGFLKIIESIRKLVDSLLETYNLTPQDIEVLGFGVPSFINQQGKVTCVNLNWYEEDFITTLRETFPEFKVAAENDATVAALAEAKFGSMKGYPYAVMLTLGTGLGAGIIINGQPFVGAHGMGSELGHVVIGINDFKCKCGNNGCFETFCSATGIVRHTKRLIRIGRKSCLVDVCKGELNRLSAKKVFDAYRIGDEVAVQSINRFKKYLAIGIANIINGMDPHIIAIGGGVSRASDIILDGLEEEIRKHILYKKEDFAKVVVAQLGNEAGIIGAAFLEQKQFG
ncbi:MAG: ROK family protein [Cellulosilyticum sp.]|nr:ROK family protein [Cellulosilyticum sp.]